MRTLKRLFRSRRPSRDVSKPSDLTPEEQERERERDLLDSTAVGIALNKMPPR